MDARGKAICRTLGVSLSAAVLVASAKLGYGYWSRSLAFTADGIHGIFDSLGTAVGMFSVYLSSKPPDEGHPYGHRKFETVSAIILGLLLLPAAYEVGSHAFERLTHDAMAPQFNFLGIVILVTAMGVNTLVARLEDRQARLQSSNFLAADATHNRADFLTTFTVLASVVATQLQVPHVDAVTSLGIAVYLAFLSVKLMVENLKPLVDTSVLDPLDVQRIASNTDGVLHCHNIRSRGDKNYLFVDLNIHLPGNITLERAHDITHEVEERLKAAFPGIVDVVIHTEPDGHPPCLKE